MSRTIELTMTSNPSRQNAEEDPKCSMRVIASVTMISTCTNQARHNRFGNAIKSTRE